MPTGTVKWFNTAKGYGFIEPNDGSALPGRRRQTGVRGELPSVGEVPEEPFRPKDHGELGTDTPQGLQDRRRRLRGLGLCREKRIALCLHRPDLFENELQSVEFSAEPLLQADRERPSVASSERLQLLAPVPVTCRSSAPGVSSPECCPLRSCSGSIVSM